MTYLFYPLLIGLFAGWVVGTDMKDHGFAVFRSLAVGAIGAVLGGFLFRQVGFAAIGLLGNLVAAATGAVVLLVMLRMIKT